MTVPSPELSAQPQPNPFAGTPWSDWVRDIAAFFLLLASLGLPWSYQAGDATERIEVILITVLSILSLAVIYLARFGAFGPGITLNGILLVRMLMNAPYLVLVIVYIGIDVFSEYGGGALGTASAVGLAGAFLAAQPREFEVKGESADGPVVRLWNFILLGVAGLVGLTTLLSLILGTISITKSSSDAGVGLSSMIMFLIPMAAVIALFVFVIRRSEVARTLGIAIGGLMLPLMLLGHLVDARNPFALTRTHETIHFTGYNMLWIAVAAGLLSSPGIRLAMNAIPPLNRWFGVITNGLLVIAGSAGYLLIVGILGFLYPQNVAIGLLIGYLLCVLAVGVGAVIGRTRMKLSPLNAQHFMLILLFGIVVFGIIALVLHLGRADEVINSMSWSQNVLLITAYPVILMFIAFPLFLASLLFMPVSVRTSFAAHMPARPAAAAASGYPTVAAYPQSAQPPAPPVAPPAPPAAPAPKVSASMKKAMNPATSAADLHALAQEDSALWPAIAENPSAYPALLEWLAQVGGPEVAAALARRPKA